MNEKQSPAQKRQENLKLFFDYCCETYKNKIEGNSQLLQEVYNIIAEMHGEAYMDLFYGARRDNGIYLKVLQDFCNNKPSKGSEWVKRNWEIRQASNKIIKLINQKL